MQYEVIENGKLVYVYNIDEMLEPATDATVSLDLADSTGKNTTYKFDALGAGHYLRIDNLTPGQYTYKATANIAGKTFTKSGIVSVRIGLKEYVTPI